MTPLGGSRLGRLAALAAAPLLLSPAVVAILRTPACSAEETLTVTVAANPEVEPAVAAAARRIDGPGCVRYAVSAVSPAVTEHVVAGDGLAADDSPPDVWIPDSSAWTVRVGLTGPSVAQSPLVIAVPAGLRGDGVAPTWTDLLARTLGRRPPALRAVPALALPDPDEDAAGIGLVALARVLLPDARRLTEFVRAMDTRTPAAFGPGTATVTSERTVWFRDTVGEGPRLTAVYPAEGTLLDDYPFAEVTGDPVKRAAAGRLYGELRTAAGERDVHAAGLRTPDGQAPATFGPGAGVIQGAPRTLLPLVRQEVEADLKAWSSIIRGMRMLVAVDVSGSMAARLPATVTFVREDLGRLPAGSEAGLWTFAGGHAEVVPVGPLDGGRRGLLDARLGALRPAKRGRTSLYASLLAAYEAVRDGYRPDLTNALLVLTDGRDDDPRGPGLRKAVAALKAAQDPRRPVSVIVVGLGPGVDGAALRTLTRPVGGLVHPSANPGEAGAFLVELLARGLAGS